MRRPWLGLIVLLAAACSASAESAPPPSDASYQVRLRDLEARVEALKEELGRQHRGPCFVALPSDDGGAALDEEPQPEAGVE